MKQMSMELYPPRLHKGGMRQELRGEMSDSQAGEKKSKTYNKEQVE